MSHLACEQSSSCLDDNLPEGQLVHALSSTLVPALETNCPAGHVLIVSQDPAFTTAENVPADWNDETIKDRRVSLRMAH